MTRRERIEHAIQYPKWWLNVELLKWIVTELRALWAVVDVVEDLRDAIWALPVSVATRDKLWTALDAYQKGQRNE